MSSSPSQLTPPWPIDILGPIEYNKMPAALLIRGTVSQPVPSGSNTITDMTKSFPTNFLANSLFIITLPSPTLGGMLVTRYYSIASNTNNTITITGTFDVDVPATTPYAIVLSIGGGGTQNVNVTQVSGTAQTADDWTARFKALSDDTVKGLLRSLGDAGDTPTNTTGRTVLSYLSDILAQVNNLGTILLYQSTSIPLAANGTFTSNVESYASTGRITGTVFADAPGTLIVEQSPNIANWDIQDSFAVQANVGLGFSVEKVAGYTRVRYVNGATAQTVFRLYIYRRLKVI